MNTYVRPQCREISFALQLNFLASGNNWEAADLEE